MSKELEAYKKDKEKLLEKMDLNGVTRGDYDPKIYAIECGRKLQKAKEVFYEVARMLYAIRVAEPYQDFVELAKSYAGLSERQANFYAQTYHEAREIAISAEQMNELGPKKVHALYQLAPPEAVEELKETGSIKNISLSETTIKELKEILSAFNSKSAHDLQYEQGQNSELHIKMKNMERKNKELTQKLEQAEGKSRQFIQEPALDKAIIAMQEANHFLEHNILENDFVRTLADAKLRFMEDEMHRLLHHIRGLAFPDPFDENNPEVQRIKNDPRFDWNKLDDDEAKDETQQN